MRSAKSAFCVILLAAVLPAAGLGGDAEISSAPLESPHGGVVHAASRTNFELVSSGPDLKVYLFDHALKPIPIRERTLSGVALARNGKKRPVAFRAAGDHWEGKLDPKDGHRIRLELIMGNRDRSEAVSFDVETSE